MSIETMKLADLPYRPAKWSCNCSEPDRCEFRKEQERAARVRLQELVSGQDAELLADFGLVVVFESVVGDGR